MDQSCFINFQEGKKHLAKPGPNLVKFLKLQFMNVLNKLESLSLALPRLV
jgi:hypothetical protein